MGKTNQKLTIWVTKEWLEHPRVKELEEKGHVIHDLMLADATQPDLILTPAAHHWDDTMWDYLPVALKAARARRYPAKRSKKENRKDD